jgi:hypothetical protein
MSDCEIILSTCISNHRFNFAPFDLILNIIILFVQTGIKNFIETALFWMVDSIFPLFDWCLYHHPFLDSLTELCPSFMFQKTAWHLIVNVLYNVFYFCWRYFSYIGKTFLLYLCMNISIKFFQREFSCRSSSWCQRLGGRFDPFFIPFLCLFRYFFSIVCIVVVGKFPPEQQFPLLVVPLTNNTKKPFLLVFFFGGL